MLYLIPASYQFLALKRPTFRHHSALKSFSVPPPCLHTASILPCIIRGVPKLFHHRVQPESNVLPIVTIHIGRVNICGYSSWRNVFDLFLPFPCLCLRDSLCWASSDSSISESPVFISRAKVSPRKGNKSHKSAFALPWNQTGRPGQPCLKD